MKMASGRHPLRLPVNSAAEPRPKVFIHTYKQKT